MAGVVSKSNKLLIVITSEAEGSPQAHIVCTSLDPSASLGMTTGENAVLTTAEGDPSNWKFFTEKGDYENSIFRDIGLCAKAFNRTK